MKLGAIHFANGTTYEGEWMQGLKSGKGNQYWPDGSVYSGEWRENKSNGKG